VYIANIHETSSTCDLCVLLYACFMYMYASLCKRDINHTKKSLSMQEGEWSSSSPVGGGQSASLT